MLGPDEVDEARFEYRVDGIVEVLEVVVAAGLAQMTPVVELCLSEQVARLWEGRHPLAIHQPRVPTHMIEMQVSTKHGGNAGRREAGGCHVLEKCRFDIAEDVVLALAIGADA